MVQYQGECGQLTQLGECLLDVEEVTGSSPVLSTSPNLKRTPFERTFLGFLFFLLQTYSYQILFRHYFGVIQRKTDDIQIPTENNNALKLKFCRTENKGGSPSGSAAIASFRALLSFVFVVLFVAGA